MWEYMIILYYFKCIGICYSQLYYCFKGDFFHACPKHYPDGDVLHPLRGLPMKIVRRKKFQRNSVLRSHGYHVIEIWECQFKQLLETSITLRLLQMQQRICSHEPIEPREALFGGRVEVFKCFVPESKDSIIEYYGEMFYSIYLSKNYFV